MVIVGTNPITKIEENLRNNYRKSTGIISTRRYDVIDDGTNYSVINRKNDDILYENINELLLMLLPTNTGEEVSDYRRKLLEFEQRAVSNG